MMEPCRLAASQLACRRGERLLFTGLSLDLQSGDAIHVTGANGTGKSSLIRILAGLLRPFAGNVMRTGSLALMDDHRALDDHLPLGQALGFWQRLDGCITPDAAMSALQLQDLMDVPVRFLSTGQRKRAALACLLNGGSQIWLLDEPINGLDAQASKTLEALLAHHCDGGGIALVASHQPIALPDQKNLHLPDFAI